jgi:hypothetical protein
MGDFLSLADQIKAGVSVAVLADRIERGELKWFDEYARITRAGEEEKHAALDALKTLLGMKDLPWELLIKEKGRDHLAVYIAPESIDKQDQTVQDILHRGVFTDGNDVVDKPLSTTERNTLLTIIAALCDYSAIKYQERGAAVQIAKMTQEIGAAVNDDTIRTILAKIPNALETRMK